MVQEVEVWNKLETVSAFCRRRLSCVSLDAVLMLRTRIILAVHHICEPSTLLVAMECLGQRSRNRNLPYLTMEAGHHSFNRKYEEWTGW